MNNQKQVLIAEDNPALAAVLKFNIELGGFQVTVARTGTDAYEVAQATDFDLIITDHQMPGMSGVQLCEKLRLLDQYKDTDVIMLTAKSLELDSERIINELGVRDIFSKPFSPTEIVKVVTNIFSQPAV